MCAKNNIEYYPSLRVFRPSSEKYRGIEVKTGSSQYLLDSFVRIISEHKSKSNLWPNLNPYMAKDLKKFFTGRNETLGFLVVENNGSTLGCKLILDFVEHKNKALVRRATETNKALLSTLNLDSASTYLPLIYLVNKNANSNVFKRFDENVIIKYAKANNINNYDTNLPYGITNDKKMSLLIGKYITLKSIFNNNKLSNTAKNINSTFRNHTFNSSLTDKKQTKESQIDRSKIYMQDLESGLTIMLRSDIGNFKSITGEKLNALKEWLRILNKYFPARMQVKNFLKRIYNNVSQLAVLTNEEWIKNSIEKTNDSFLSDIVTWRNCQGSEPNYRGYPCSLWLIFHVLTVSQIEINQRSIEMGYEQSFKRDFDVKEVIEAIRLFVANFFTCQECVVNFLNGTNDRARFLVGPNDAVEYLWKIHNGVNRRLAIDHADDQDPVYPKVLFPTRVECSKCYLNSEDSWNTNEVFSFLMKYYSTKNIIY